jgi:hypothetical protein
MTTYTFIFDQPTVVRDDTGRHVIPVQSMKHFEAKSNIDASSQAEAFLKRGAVTFGKKKHRREWCRLTKEVTIARNAGKK